MADEEANALSLEFTVIIVLTLIVLAFVLFVLYQGSISGGT